MRSRCKHDSDDSEEDEHKKEEKKRDKVRKSQKEVKEKVKKWREKDKKGLFERVKEKYLQFRKMRINVVRVTPAVKKPRSQQRKRSKKRQTKVHHLGGQRSGLRSAALDQEMGPLGEEPVQEEEQKGGDEIMEKDDVIMAEEDEEEEEEDTVLNGVHYKFGNPVYPPDIEWTVTLSRNDFPWPEIATPLFTAQECYEKYASIVTDPHTFLKKVLGLKDKYKKLMQNQL